LPNSQKFIQNFCRKLPTTNLKDGKRIDFGRDIISQTFNINTCSKATINVDELKQIFDISTYFADFTRNFIGEITNMW